MRYFLTEWFLDGTLEELLYDSNKNLKPITSDIFDVLCDVANGLKSLHTRPRGIMHRDIKPRNICCQRVEGVGGKLRGYIIDMGLACRIPKNGDKIQVCGSHSMEDFYFAPELQMDEAGHVNGFYYNEKVDVYSFGKILLAVRDSISQYHGERIETFPGLETYWDKFSDIIKQATVDNPDDRKIDWDAARMTFKMMKHV